MTSEAWIYCDGTYRDGTPWRTETVCYPGSECITHER